MKLWGHPSLRVVDVKPFDDNIRTILTSNATTAEDWCNRGAEFLSRKAYGEARQCYQRGGDKKNEQLCVAKILQLNAEMEEFKNPLSPVTRAKFKEAAIYYEAPPLESFADAAFLFKKAHEFKLAAQLFRQKLSLWNEAGDCYNELKMWEDAAEMFFLCNNVEKSLEACERGGLYKLGLDVCNRLNLAREEGIRKNWVTKAIDYYVSIANIDEVMLFLNEQDLKIRVKFLEKRGLFGLLAEVLNKGMKQTIQFFCILCYRTY